MSWSRFDDMFDDDGDIVRLSDPAFRLYVNSITWSRRHESAGYLTEQDLRAIAAKHRIRSVKKVVAELLAPSPNPGSLSLYVMVGKLIHIRQYEKYNPHTSKERMRAKRAREAGERDVPVTPAPVTSDAPVTQSPVTSDAGNRHMPVTGDGHVTTLAGAPAVGLSQIDTSISDPDPGPVPASRSPKPPSRDGPRILPEARPILDVWEGVSGRPPSGPDVDTAHVWIAEFTRANTDQVVEWVTEAVAYRASEKQDPARHLSTLHGGVKVRYISWCDDLDKAGERGKPSPGRTGKATSIAQVLNGSRAPDPDEEPPTRPDTSRASRAREATRQPAAEAETHGGAPGS